MRFRLPRIPKRKHPFLQSLFLGTVITTCIIYILYQLLLRFGDKTASWATYVNTTYGFTLRYPKAVPITVQELDVSKAKKEYDSFCQTHEGCGGARWPEYVLNFQTKDNVSFFMLDIYQIPVDFQMGEKVHNNFTFLVREPYNLYFFEELKDIPKRYIDPTTISSIRQSLKFIPPDKPLPCLWVNEGGIPSDFRTMEEFKDKVTTISGYFYQKDAKACENISYDAWVYDPKTLAPPFLTKEGCENTCNK